MSKTKIAVLFGGKSPEHKISLLSARSVIDNLDTDRYELVLIGIDPTGKWYSFGKSIVFENEGNPNTVSLPSGGEEVYFSQNHGEHSIISKESGSVLAKVDVVFPVLHGVHGEDGSVQGLMKLAGLACVGSDTLGAAVCMDKDVTKRLLRDAGVKVAPFVTLRHGYNHDISYTEITEKLGTELYIKPANLGSSLGISYVDNEADYHLATQKAFRYDKKVLIEQKIIGKEIECAVLGNESPRASVIGEIAPASEFYSFESKYVDEDDAMLTIPADISDNISLCAQELAVKVFVLLECKGFARVDMFATPLGDLILNEVNTIPGFTNISMYPKLWEKSGIPYADLLTRLITLAIERQEDTEALI